MKPRTEYRAGTPAKVETDGSTVKVSGYAAVFNQRADIGGIFLEQIAPGAFTAAVTRDDVVFLVNHEGLPLARTRSGTLKLSQDDHGLFIESELETADPDVMKIIPKMKRGDLDKMSFGFIPNKQEWDESGEIPIRTIIEASLFDVSIVTNPAYDGTEIGLRSLQAHREQNQQSASIQARLRMKLAISATA